MYTMKTARLFAAALVLSLLAISAPAAPSADDVLKQAQATAKAEGKNIFLLFDSPG